MKQTITKAIKNFLIEYYLTEYKQQKINNTQTYLMQNRQAQSPQIPMGFKSRKSSEYYLSSIR
jgi:hypothetical protein